MMHRILVMALLCGLAAASPAMPGAWLREDGRAFLSVSGIVRRTVAGHEQETGLYGEYGLLPRLTIGIDLNERPALAGHALVFARLPLIAQSDRTRLALEIAAGAHHWQTNWHPMTRATLSLGRAFQAGRGYQGWLNLDAAYERRYGFLRPAYKLDLTAGLSSGLRLRPLLQIETTLVPGQGRYWTVTPAILFGGGRGRGTAGIATWLVGVERKSAPQDSVGLKLALWRRF
ncbi:MAG: hypothetical protein ACK5MY_07265 [Jhaorihella sp.]